MTRSENTDSHVRGWTSALVGGTMGAVALTAVHQAAQSLVPRAPRMDRVGMRAIARGLHALGHSPPTGRTLYRTTLAGDLVANAAYYALAAFAGRRAVTAGLVLGAGAGLGALVLPRHMGLDDPPHSEALENQLMTVAWYMFGGLVAGATMNAVAGRRHRGEPSQRLVRVATPGADWRRAEAP